MDGWKYMFYISELPKLTFKYIVSKNVGILPIYVFSTGEHKVF